LRVDGVRAQGLTVPAVFVRSRARIRRYETITLAERPADELLKELADMLTGRLPG
jgi:hypothetical protein